MIEQHPVRLPPVMVNQPTANDRKLTLALKPISRYRIKVIQSILD
jgi:hypothetical protein